jgi:hypothetical protein
VPIAALKKRPCLTAWLWSAQRWRRQRNLLRTRIASDLNHRPDRLAILASMIMLDVSKLRMNECRRITSAALRNART